MSKSVFERCSNIAHGPILGAAFGAVTWVEDPLLHNDLWTRRFARMCHHDVKCLRHYDLQRLGISRDSEIKEIRCRASTLNIPNVRSFENPCGLGPETARDRSGRGTPGPPRPQRKPERAEVNSSSARCAGGSNSCPNPGLEAPFRKVDEVATCALGADKRTCLRSVGQQGQRQQRARCPLLPVSGQPWAKGKLQLSSVAPGIDPPHSLGDSPGKPEQRKDGPRGGPASRSPLKRFWYPDGSA